MTEKTKKRLGQELKEIRLSEGISLRKMAAMAGLSKETTASIIRVEEGNFDSPTLPRKFLEAMGYKFQEKYAYKIVKPNKAK